MVTLELLVDATGAQRGAQQSEAALRWVRATSERSAQVVRSAASDIYGGGSSVGGRSSLGFGSSLGIGSGLGIYGGGASPA